jgi:Replication initiator protein, pSAM2
LPNNPTAGAAQYPGGCLQPVLLRGRVDHIDGATGELLHRYTTVHEPGGVLPIACKTRRASQCPPCAEVYRADTYQVISAGLSGGKGIPATVAEHPSVFTTLTAPSFGPVHLHREKDGRLLRCRPRRRSRTCLHGRRMSCGVKHTRDDTRLGEPLCPDCYDYSGAVLFNALAPELWRRFTISLRRALARQAGLTNKALAAQVRVSYAKVAEYQRRGVVHFHAIIRLDGRAGPTTAPPAWATLALLTAAIDQAARSVNFQTAAAPGVPARTLAWGRELDTRPITSTGELTDTRVAAYVAKYATKAAECTGTLDRRITPADKLTDLPIRDHARRLIAECLRLGKLPGLEDLRLTAWAHMLGFRGHFSTKSRAYSITLGSLRADRSQHQREHAIAAGLQPDLDPDSTLVLARWQFVGRGHEPPIPPGSPDPRPPAQRDGPHREEVDDVA